MRDDGDGGGRNYATAGCLTLIALPLTLLGAWSEGALTWPRILGWGLAGAAVIVLPLVLAGRGRT